MTRSMARLCAALALAGALATASLHTVLAGPVGPEFRVNSHRDFAQYSPAVARLKGGGFVVVWLSKHLNRNASEGYLFGQRFSANGARLGSEFRVDDENEREVGPPTVTALSDGSFLVTWVSRIRAGNKDHMLYKRRYSAGGAPLEGNVRLPVTGGRILALSDGYLMYWHLGEQISKRFDNAGRLVADSGFRLPFSAGDPGVAALLSSRRVAMAGVMTQNRSPPLEQYVMNHLFSPAGTLIATDKIHKHIIGGVGTGLVNTTIAALTGGGYVIAWGKIDSAGSSISGKRFNGNGDQRGNVFRINDSRVGARSGVRLAALSGGGFVATWSDEAVDGSGRGIFVQYYTASGAPIGGNVRVNTETEHDQDSPVIAPLGNNRFVVVWVSDRQDGSSSGIYGQILEP